MSNNVLLKDKKVARSTGPFSKKIALGLSGGVDSSVAALLLKEQGYDVTGVFMQCWDFKADGCKADEDRDFAVRTAGTLGIKFEHLDFREHYKSKVVDYFYSEYEKGRTPNPDVMCNREIKFGIFYDWAMKNGFDMVSTGHYAKVIKNKLHMAVDVTKDQSYFLYRIKPEQFEKILFPLGNLKKKEVRDLAVKAALPTATRPESMGICFIGEVDIKDFLKKRIAPKPGEVLDTMGNLVGEHDGAWYFTIGQRHGFRLRKYFGHPMYVLNKDIDTNTIVIGEKKETYTSELRLNEMSWLEKPAEELFDVLVRIRHLGKLHKAKVNATHDEDNVHVVFEQPVFGVAQGQSAVIYKDEKVLGGGVIV